MTNFWLLVLCANFWFFASCKSISEMENDEGKPSSKYYRPKRENSPNSYLEVQQDDVNRLQDLINRIQASNKNDQKILDRIINDDLVKIADNVRNISEKANEISLNFYNHFICGQVTSNVRSMITDSLSNVISGLEVFYESLDVSSANRIKDLLQKVKTELNKINRIELQTHCNTTNLPVDKSNTGVRFGNEVHEIVTHIKNTMTNIADIVKRADDGFKEQSRLGLNKLMRLGRALKTMIEQSVDLKEPEVNN